MSTKARTQFRLISSGRFTWDIGSTTAGAQATTAINLPGAKVGDAVIATPDAAQAGFLYDGRVTSAATVTLRAVNASGSTADPASTTISVLVLRA